MSGRAPFGTTKDGRAVAEYTLTNAAGASLKFIDYGGIVTEIKVPDRAGKIANVTLGFAELAPYEANAPFFGTLVGRFCNRIGGARFTLDGTEYRVTQNEGANMLHGGNGPTSLNRVVWQVEQLSPTQVRLTHTSPDGAEGFPGTLAVSVTYTLADDNSWRIDYEATTDKPTVINLTNHAYFNLAGDGAGSIEGHILEIAADAITAGDAAGIPTGELLPVDGTPFDFRKATPIGARIRASYPQLASRQGYDHNYALRDAPAPAPAFAARLSDPASGRTLTLETTEPGVQFYSGNFLDGRLTGRAGRQYRQGDGLCLETQHFPDAPNKPEFASTVLRPGETFRSTTIHRFGVEG